MRTEKHNFYYNYFVFVSYIFVRGTCKKFEVKSRTGSKITAQQA